MSTLLAIFAHPDDESFGPGAGTLAKYAHEGAQVHSLCLTRGEAGTVDEALLQQYGSVAELRTKELERAAQATGLAGLHWLDYRDSGMAGAPDNRHPQSLFVAPLDEVAARIAEVIREVEPDVIITHDPYGWYGHPDHIKCYEATLRAYALLYGVSARWIEAEDERRWTMEVRPLWSAQPPALYVASFSKWLTRLAVRLLPLLGRDPRRYGQNGDIDLVEIASWDVPVATRVKVAPYLDIKERAIASHASQRPLDSAKNGLARLLLRRIHSVENFARVYPRFKKGEPVETGLFRHAADFIKRTTQTRKVITPFR